MPTSRKRKTPLDPGRQGRLEDAVAEVKERLGKRQQACWGSTAKKYNVSVSSLRYQVQGDRSRDLPPPVTVKPPGAPLKLGPELEKKLMEWVLGMCEVNLTPTMLKLRYTMAAVAKKRGIEFLYKDGSTLPTVEFCMEFIKRNGLTYRKVAGISSSRQEAEGNLKRLENWIVVMQEVLGQPCVISKKGKTLATYAQRPDRIGNADETGWQRQTAMEKGVMEKGTKASYRPVSESKESLTQFCWGTAEGKVLPPMYILKGTCPTKNYLQNTSYAGSAVMMKAQSHFIDSDLMTKLLGHLADTVPGGVSKKNRFLLILDGHESRMGLEFITKAKELGFDVVVFPGKCTHFLQPWDQCFGAVKQRYKTLQSEWTNAHGSTLCCCMYRVCNIR